MVDELADEVKHLEARLASENERLGHEWTGAGKIPPRITTEIVEQLTPQATRDRGHRANARDRPSTSSNIHRTGEHQFRSQIESAMTGGDKLGLPKDVDAAGDLVAQLRRRQQVEQRIEAAREQADELQQQGQDLVDEQVVPIGLFSWLLARVRARLRAAVARGGSCRPRCSGKYGGWIARGRHRRLGLRLAVQILRRRLGLRPVRRLPPSNRNWCSSKSTRPKKNRSSSTASCRSPKARSQLRLQHAERHLAELERMLPVESQRREAAQEIDVGRTAAQAGRRKTRGRAGQLEGQAAGARPAGRRHARQPGHDGRPMRAAGRAAKHESKTAATTCHRRQREFAIVSQRIVALAEETGLRREKADAARAARSPAGRVSPAAAARRPPRDRSANGPRRCKVEAVEARPGRDRLPPPARRAVPKMRRRRRARTAATGRRARRGRRAAQEAGRRHPRNRRRDRQARHRGRFRPAAGRRHRSAGWSTIGKRSPRKSEELDRELEGTACSAAARWSSSSGPPPPTSRSPTKQIELDVVEQQIKKAIDAWRERAAVSLFLERIRDEYEQHRQPETLREASTTWPSSPSGKYTRIWTPLAHDILFVDTADGQPLPVQVLSRGTREQLFVSLRLALVAAYARRGIHLPMILDDVFVNFDAGRTKTAVRRAPRVRQARAPTAGVHLPRARVADVPGYEGRHAANSEPLRRGRRRSSWSNRRPRPSRFPSPSRPSPSSSRRR